MSKTKIIIFSILGAVIVSIVIFGTADLIPNLQNSVKGSMNLGANILLIVKWAKVFIAMFVTSTLLIFYIMRLAWLGRRWWSKLTS